MNTYEIPNKPVLGDPRTIIFDTLGGFDVIDKDSMSEVDSKNLTYLVMLTKLHVGDIHCIEAKDIRYIFLPTGTVVSFEDQNHMHIHSFANAQQGYDIYVEEIHHLL